MAQIMPGVEQEGELLNGLAPPGGLGAPGGQVPLDVQVQPGVLALVMEEIARLKEASNLLVQQAEDNKVETRKGKIAAALAATKSAAGKRTVC